MNARIGFEELEKNVVERNICASCGACVVVCPFADTLEYHENGPKTIGECILCGICPQVCPRYMVQADELEKLVFGRVRKPEEDFGIYRKIYVAKSTDNEVLKRCQDGGVATTLINIAMDLGTIDGAIVSGLDPSIPWLPIPFIAKSKGEVIYYSGTRYTYSPNLLALGRCATEGIKKIALVGVPCHISPFRQIQKIPIKKFSEMVAFTIGLFCAESFTYNGLMVKKIRDEMGIALSSIEKMNIKGKMLLTLNSGKIVEIPLKEVKQYAEAKCRSCGDFSAELADISLGGLGLNGWTFTVIRTEQGEKLLNHALEKKALEIKPVKDFPRPFRLLKLMSKNKQKICSENSLK